MFRLLIFLNFWRRLWFHKTSISSWKWRHSDKTWKSEVCRKMWRMNTLSSWWKILLRKTRKSVMFRRNCWIQSMLCWWHENISVTEQWSKPWSNSRGHYGIDGKRPHPGPMHCHLVCHFNNIMQFLTEKFVLGICNLSLYTIEWIFSNVNTVMFKFLQISNENPVNKNRGTTISCNFLIRIWKFQSVPVQNNTNFLWKSWKN